MLVEPADGGISKENAPAAIRLQAVLVRIDDDGVGVWNGVEGGAGFAWRDCRARVK